MDIIENNIKQKISKISKLTDKILYSKLNQNSKDLSNITSKANNKYVSNIDLLFLISNNLNKKINNEISLIKNDRKNLNQLLNFSKAVEKNSVEAVKGRLSEVKDPLDFFKKKTNNSSISKGFGIIGSLEKSFIKQLVKRLLNPAIKLIGNLTKKVGKLGLNIVKKSGKFIFEKGGNLTRKVITKIGQSRIGQAVTRNIGRGLSRGLGRSLLSTGARFLGRAALVEGAGMLGAGIGAGALPVLGTVALAGAVGYGSYKLAKYLDLSGKLDSFISKQTSGKYRDLADIIIGIKDGAVGSDLSEWFKEKTQNIFTDSFTWIKTKVVDLMKKLNPFSKVSDDDIKTENNVNKIKSTNNLSKAAVNSITSNNTVTYSDNTNTQQPQEESWFDKAKSTLSSWKDKALSVVGLGNNSGNQDGDVVTQDSGNYPTGTISGGNLPVTKYDGLMKQIYSAAGFSDKDQILLKAQVKAESQFNPNAHSGAGAAGLVQFMPGTWKQYGTGGADNRYNPEANLKAQAKYMKYLLNMFHGNWAKALAGYNGGENRLRNRGEDISRMPKESRDYVKKIFKFAGASDNVNSQPTNTNKQSSTNTVKGSSQPAQSVASSSNSAVSVNTNTSKATNNKAKNQTIQQHKKTTSGSTAVQSQSAATVKSPRIHSNAIKNASHSPLTT